MHAHALERAARERELREVCRDVVDHALSGDDPTCAYTLLVLQAVEDQAGVSSGALATVRKDIQAAASLAARGLGKAATAHAHRDGGPGGGRAVLDKLIFRFLAIQLETI